MNKRLTMQEIKQALKDDVPDARLLEDLRTDERKGVQQALASYDRRRRKQKQLEEDWRAMLSFDDQCRGGRRLVTAGVDEVGRGPLAGPVTAAAVILPEDAWFPGLTDSKKLTSEEREVFQRHLENEAVTAVGEASVEEIDRLNIYQASRLAMLRAVEQLDPQPELLLIDAVGLDTDIEQQAIVKGDTLSASIAAASVTAKIHRDHYMTELGSMHPAYRFAENAGYGTKDHLAALDEEGVTEHHRRSFSPVKARLSRRQ
ncbi:ribonuclease HII [Alkalicoccus chagannorensis]|uniref:ribonuclease HII n=1 Tax=Alkalicoccus chagannorensis TaxID=427072 RepID=UPI0004132670|nr:ribonuclease HII [Alkalicoccus chagannorensis]